MKKLGHFVFILTLILASKASVAEAKDTQGVTPMRATVEDTIIDGHHKYMSLVQVIGDHGFAAVKEVVDASTKQHFTFITFSSDEASPRILFSLSHIAGGSYLSDPQTSPSDKQAMHAFTDSEILVQKGKNSLNVSFLQGVVLGGTEVRGTIKIPLK